MNIKRLSNLNRLLRAAIWLKKNGDPVPELIPWLANLLPCAIIAALGEEP